MSGDPPGVDLAALTRWMDGEGLGTGPLEGVTPMAGGTQNVMVRLARDGREYVLRRGPLHLRERSNVSIRRETTLLAALATTPVPHPRLIRACADDDVLGAAFYLMEPVAGFNPGVELPPPYAADPGARRAAALAVVDALALLGEVDHEAVGLGAFGRPEGFLDRQVERWLAELESYRADPAYVDSDPPALDAVAPWLDQRRPAASMPGVMHGDFHLANVLIAPDAPRVAAIVDWEMATIGDPLLDLGWLLATWPPDGGGRDVLDTPFAAAGGLPDAGEVVARYAQRSRRDLDDIAWYVVLACFKLGILLEGTFARSLVGKASRETGEQLRAGARALAARASTIVAAGGLSSVGC